jgi:hypothetical protein
VSWDYEPKRVWLGMTGVGRSWEPYSRKEGRIGLVGGLLGVQVVLFPPYSPSRSEVGRSMISHEMLELLILR